MPAILSLLLAFCLVGDGKESHFSEVELEEPFSAYLKANPLLMELTGAKVILLKDGRRMVLGVASTAIKDGTAKDRLRVEKVCRTKALAAVVAEKKGVQVAREERLEERTVVVVEDRKESAKTVSDLLEVTRTRVEGIARDMPVVGRWKSSDGEVFYLAIGVILDLKGEPISKGD